ncbi:MULTISPECIES: type II toxin-antitoxin system VapC family toxin [Nostoc]|uniref:type II toxin-antitoxin system VapC family toxin n=1 Tax=Nostoc TaxID=1177 RepID=UPI0018C6FC89|nr:type II toxin-antitoxin system VapC family toxin [Nostoc commune]MBG1260320.1 type II toxin-antitoxin system VapC family toxin [Nostoc commune BAE]
MKLLLDTCVVIWFLQENPCLLSETYEAIADSENEVFVSAVSAWEIEIKRGKRGFECPDDLLAAIIYSQFNVLSLTIAHAIKAGSLPMNNNHKDPFDRMLVAQAMIEKMVLVTSDTKIIGNYAIAVLPAKNL